MFTVPIDVNEPHWAMHKKHVFILSEAGKPIYSRYVAICWYNGLIFLQLLMLMPDHASGKSSWLTVRSMNCKGNFLFFCVPGMSELGSTFNDRQ